MGGKYSINRFREYIFSLIRARLEVTAQHSSGRKEIKSHNPESNPYNWFHRVGIGCIGQVGCALTEAWSRVIEHSLDKENVCVDTQSTSLEVGAPLAPKDVVQHPRFGATTVLTSIVSVMILCSYCRRKSGLQGGPLIGMHDGQSCCSKR